MNKKEIPSDECLTNAAIQELHHAIVKSGTEKPLNDLLERETSLGAYVLFSAHQVSEIVRVSGAPSRLVAWVKDAVTAHILVCIEAQRQAHYELWRDFMGDFSSEASPKKPNDPTKGK